jgi:hypothetical protein
LKTNKIDIIEEIKEPHLYVGSLFLLLLMAGGRRESAESSLIAPAAAC